MADGFKTTAGLSLQTTFEKTITGVDLDECVSKCKSYEPVYTYKQKCAAIVYNTATQTCQLSSNSKDTVVPETGFIFDKDYIYMERG